MRGGVIRLGPTPAGAIHLGLHGVTQGELTPFDTTGMNKHIPTATDGVDRDNQIITRQHATIAHLTAALAVEGGGVEHHLHGITRLRDGGRLTVDHQGQHAAGLLQRLIALEIGGLLIGGNLIDGVLKGEVDADRRGLGPLALFLHRRFKAIEINSQALLLSDFLS